jgi:hypothetical protein
MARIITNGFEMNSTTAGHEWEAVVGAVISTSVVRTGTYAGNIPSLVSGVGKYFQHQFALSDTAGDYYLRFYLYIDTTPDATTAIAQISNDLGTNGISLQLLTNRTLKLIISSGSTQIGNISSALNTAQWYCIEIHYNSSPAAGSQVCECRIDQASPFATSSALTLVNPDNFAIGANLQGNAATTLNLYFDDVAFNDSTGANQNSWPGSGKVINLKPSAAGDVNTFGTQTGGTAGAGNNFTRVNEGVPDDASTFNGSSTLNQEDLFNMDDSGIGASDTINVVAVNGRFRNSTADATAKIKFEIEKAASGTILQSAAITVNSTTWKTNAIGLPRTAPIVSYANPDGAAWTQALLDSMQAGYKLTTGPGTAGRRIDVTKLWVTVDYTPVSTSGKRSSPLALLGVG